MVKVQKFTYGFQYRVTTDETMEVGI